MHFRYARHTSSMAPLIAFYTELLGLEILGSFEDHDGYNGVFLGKQGAGWHLEFTESGEKADHRPDEDDLMVFYAESAEALETILGTANRMGAAPLQPKNPYLQKHGFQFRDPDNFGIIVTQGSKP